MTTPPSSMSGCGRCGRAQCAGCYIGGPDHPWSERVLDTDGYLADLVKRDEERQQEAAANAREEVDEVEIRVDHTDDSMSITVSKPRPLSNGWKPLLAVSPGIEPPFQTTFVRRHRRATREAGQ